MKTLKLIQTLTLGCLMIFLVGCASEPERKTPPVPGASEGTNAVFNQPCATVQKAVLDALTLTGFDIEKQEPTYIEGSRPHKMGLFVGSGGETMEVWLTAKAPNITEVKVNTSLSFRGVIGQRNWDDDVLAEMKKTLSK